MLLTRSLTMLHRRHFYPKVLQKHPVGHSSHIKHPIGLLSDFLFHITRAQSNRGLHQTKRWRHRSRWQTRRRWIFLISLGVLLFLAPILYLTLLHPGKISAAPWSTHHSQYAQRKQLTLVNNSGQTFESGTTYKVTIDTASLYNSGSILSTCDDLRVVYQPSTTQATELKRALEYASSSSGVTTCTTSSATKVVFQLQANISNSGTDDDYYIYYDNTKASAYASSDALDAYNMGTTEATFVAPFNGTTTALAAGTGTPTTATGAIRYSGGKSAMSFDGTTGDKVQPTARLSQIMGAGLQSQGYTLEGWFNFSSLPNQASSFTFGGYYYAGFYIKNVWDKIRAGWHTSNTANFTDYSEILCNNQSTGSWTHLAMTYDGDKVRLYINGSLCNTSASTSSYVVDTGSSTYDYFNVNSLGSITGYMADEVRLSTGVRYTSNFTPQTTPFVRDEFTKLLWHFDENGDDPRNTGNAIDDSGNGNHGTITGAKYVGGLVGVDGATSSPTETGYQSSQGYAGHDGVFIEEGTTNKITNPSFDHATYGTNWTMSDGTVNYNSSTDTFTPNITKRNSAGPFAAGVTVQGDLVNGEALTDDVLSLANGTQVSGNFYSNFDTTQGAVVLWWTPEYSYNASAGAGLHYLWYVNSNYYLAYDYANDRFEQKVGSQTITSSRNIVSGTTYNLVTNWDTQNVLAGSDYQCFTIDDGTPTCGTVQPTASAPASTIYIGSDGTTGAVSGIIEGLTVYRRPLYDGTNGINVGNGDEVNLIMTGGSGYDGTHTGSNNAATLTDSAGGFTASALINRTIYNTTDGSSCLITANTTTTVTCILAGGSENDWDTSDAYKINFGQDPTLLTGSWDVVFDLPTNASTGSLTTGTGNAWSHPHTSNLLYTDATNTGGFMLNGTYTSDGWADVGTPSSVAALATGEKIFAGGYKTTSDAANEGISYTKAATSGNDYVLRALGNSDGTCSPQILITRADGSTEITHLNGTTASTRAAPDAYIFTWEAPATENMIVKLINTAASGTCYWHQVEVLANKHNKPSVEAGSGDPWLPTGWVDRSNPMEAGDSAQETTIVHSGTSSFKLTTTATTGEGIDGANSSGTIGNFYGSGVWVNVVSGLANYAPSQSWGALQYATVTSFPTGSDSLTFTTTSGWTHRPLVTRSGYGSGTAVRFMSSSSSGLTAYMDDSYSVALSSVSLTATSASEANSTQTSGLRVDGADTLTQPVTGLTDKSGEVIFKVTPRHNFADAAKFGSANPVIAHLYGDSNDYIKILYQSSSTLRVESQFNGTAVNSDYASPTLNAGTTYTIKVTYLQGGNQLLYIDGVQQATAAVGASVAFSTVPNTIYFGSDSAGANQYDVTIAAGVVTNPTPSENTTAPYYKFGSKSAKLTATSTDAGLYTTSINPASTATHTFSAYVYDGTSGNVGGTVDSKIASLIFGSTYPTTTYTDMGGGWWRLTASATPGLLEQYPTNMNDTDQGLYTTTSNKYLAQGFKVSSSTTVDKALLYIKKVGAGTPTTTYYRVELQTDNSGSPSGTPVTNGTSACTAVTTSTSYANITFTFSTAPSLTSGTQYHIVLKPYTNSNCSTGQSAIDATNYLSWGYDNTASFYANGDKATMNTSNAWTTGTATDHQFQLYSPNLALNYGVVVSTGKIVYVDGVQLELNYNIYHNYATSYIDGSLGTGYSWSGTAHDSTSSRTAGDLRYASTNNAAPTTGSVSFWLKPNNYISTNQNHDILVLGDTNGTYYSAHNGSLSLYVGSSNWYSSLRVLNNSGTSYIVTTTTALQTNMWKHITLVWGTNDLRYYINGVSQGTPITSATMPTSWYSDFIRIGAAQPLDGNTFSDLRIFSTALTSTQVADLYYSGLGSQTSFAPTATERYTDGDPPVLVWKFDEGYGTTAYDSTINANNGTISGATWSEDSNGGVSNAKTLKFDGTDDKISRSYSNDSELNPGTSPFSVSTWFKAPSSITGTDTLLSRYSGAGYKLYMNSSGYVCFGIDDDSTWGPDDSACTTVSFADSSWHHALAVKGDTSITLYIDGVQRATDSSLAATGSLSGSTPTLYAGIDSDGTSNPWAGFLDDVRVYNTQLSREQVLTELIARGSNKGVAARLGGKGAAENLENGLVGYWKMDEASWNGTAGEVIDASGNGNHGVRSGDATTAAGKFGNGGTFDGTTDYVQINSSSSLKDADGFENMSISFWINPDVLESAGTASYLLSKDASGANPGDFSIILDHDSARDNYLIASGVDTGRVGFATSSLAVGSWKNVVFTKTADGQGKIYLDGELKESGSGFGAIFNNDTAIEIGGVISGSLAYDGKLDDLRIYNRTLSPAEVQALYEWAPSTVAQFKMDEASWSGNGAVIDSSGNSNALTHKGNAQIASPGKFGKGSVYDGTGDYLCSDANTDGTCDDDDGFDFGTGSFSVEGWFKRPTTAAQNNLVTKAQAGTNAGYKVYMASDGDICFDIDDDSTWGPDDSACTTAATYDDNNWHHFSAVKSGTSSISISIDGVLIASDTSIAATATLSSDDPLYIGIDDNASSNAFTGNLDDIRIYNYARSQKQIVQDLNAGHPAVGSPVGSPVGYWKFDEGADNKCAGGVNDVCNSGSGGSALDGAQSGMAVPATSTSGWTNSGKFGKALNFDGSDDYLSNTMLPTLLRNSSVFSVSFWASTDSYRSDVAALSLNTDGVNTKSLIIYPYDSSGGNGTRIYFNGTTIIDQNDGNIANSSYHHFLFINESATSHKLFIDGYLYASSSTSKTLDSGLNQFNIGSWKSSTQFFNGKIDEVKIYNYALSEDEIKLEYNQGAAVVMGNTGTASDGKTADNSAARAYCPPGNVESNCAAGQTLGPLADWGLNEASGTRSDSSSNGYSLTDNNTVGSDIGKFGRSAKFNSVDSEYLSSSAAIWDTTFTESASWSISGWYYKNVNANQGIISHYNSSIFKGVILRDSATTGTFVFQWLDTTTNSRSVVVPSVPIKTWTFFEVGYDRATDKMFASINGANYTTLDVSAYTFAQLSSIPLYIGSSRGTASYFDGKIDNITVYPYAKTPAQIAWDYNRGAPLVHYRFDECSGTTANNAAPASQGDSGNDATIYPVSNDNTAVGTCGSGTATEMWNDGTTGKYSGSIGLDGNDDYVATSNVALLTTNAVTYTNASWGGWFYPSASPTSDTLIHKGNEFRLTTDGSAIPQCEIYSGSWQTALSAPSALPASTWTHVLCTYDGANQYMFVNGVMVASRAETDAITSSSSTALSIGRDSAGSGYFGGQVDDVKVWNYALTTAQVKEVFTGGAVSFK